jgi:hypothetical protein
MSLYVSLSIALSLFLSISLYLSLSECLTLSLSWTLSFALFLSFFNPLGTRNVIWEYIKNDDNNFDLYFSLVSQLKQIHLKSQDPCKSDIGIIS